VKVYYLAALKAVMLADWMEFGMVVLLAGLTEFEMAIWMVEPLVVSLVEPLVNFSVSLKAEKMELTMVAEMGV
jgi:hypothetical protein